MQQRGAGVGALVPVQAEQVEMEGRGHALHRALGVLARGQDASRSAAPVPTPLATGRQGQACQDDRDDKAVAIPGGPRDPNFNPFLNPDPALTGRTVGDAPRDPEQVPCARGTWCWRGGVRAGSCRLARAQHFCPLAR